MGGSRANPNTLMICNLTALIKENQGESLGCIQRKASVNVLFELKGVNINEKQCDMTDISDQQLSAVPLKANHADAEITTIHIPLLCCCATSFFYNIASNFV